MVKLIVAKARNNAIGKNNDLIWKLPDDMAFFTRETTGNIVIMGRRNWESIPDKYRPLKDRLNIVVTRNMDFSDEGCEVYTSVEDAILANSEDERTTFIIGGGQVYKYCLEQGLVHEMLITEIEEDFDADTFFPEFDESKWTKELMSEHEIDERHPHAFKIYRYTKN